MMQIPPTTARAIMQGVESVTCLDPFFQTSRDDPPDIPSSLSEFSALILSMTAEVAQTLALTRPPAVGSKECQISMRE